MRKLFIILLLTGIMNSLPAAGNGGYAGAFLRIGLGARGVSMGNAQVATANHGFGFYYNPAALPDLEKLSGNFSYNFLSLDRRFSYIGISMPLKPQAGFSLGWIYSGVRNITGYDSRGFQSGEVNHGLHAVYFSFGLMLIPDRLSVGVSAKYLLEDISDPDFDYDGSGFGADLGLYFHPIPSLTLGVQVKDINSNLRSNTNNIFDRGIERDNEFPVSSRVGFFYTTPWEWVRIAYDFEWSTAGQEKNHFGLELAQKGVAGRIGYDDDHLTFGGGLEFEEFLGVRTILDYAFVTSVIDEGVSHIFTWQFAF